MDNSKPRLLRITTVPISLKFLIRGQMDFMQQQGHEVLAASADGPERADVMKYEHVDHVIIPMTRTISPVSDLICLVKLIRLINKFKPTIIHTHTPKAGLLGMMAGYFCNVPRRLHTVAGLPLMEARGIKRRLLLFTEWLTYFCAHQVYPNSVVMLKFIKQHIGVREDKLKVIGKGSSNGIDVDYFSRKDEVLQRAGEIRKQYGIDDTMTTFCFVGRVVTDKGINELLHAFDKLSKTIKARLFIVGHFEDDLDPIADSSKAILTSNTDILHVGFQNDVRPYLAASDVFVFPSYREGFPNVVMQACCMELPCIVSDINGCNEIIEHEKTGIIIPPKDTDRLFEAMTMLATDRIKRTTFAKLSNDFVRSNFDQQYFWGELIREYASPQPSPKERV